MSHKHMYAHTGAYVSTLSHTHTHTVSEDESLLVARRLLVFINPIGGQGKGVSDFKQYVQPLFDMAEINCNIIVTGKPYTIEELIITACELPYMNTSCWWESLEMIIVTWLFSASGMLIVSGFMVDCLPFVLCSHTLKRIRLKLLQMLWVF